MNHDDERDFAEERANQQLMRDEQRGEILTIEVSPDEYDVIVQALEQRLDYLHDWGRTDYEHGEELTEAVEAAAGALSAVTRGVS